MTIKIDKIERSEKKSSQAYRKIKGNIEINWLTEISWIKMNTAALAESDTVLALMLSVSFDVFVLWYINLHILFNAKAILVK